MKVRVLVRLKPGIMDVQGEAVKRALAGLGFSEVSDLRVGKVIDIDLAEARPGEARARVGEMCRQLLANPILEDRWCQSELGAARSPAERVVVNGGRSEHLAGNSVGRRAGWSHWSGIARSLP